MFHISFLDVGVATQIQKTGCTEGSLTFQDIVDRNPPFDFILGFRAWGWGEDAGTMSGLRIALVNPFLYRWPERTRKCLQVESGSGWTV